MMLGQNDDEMMELSKSHFHKPNSWFEFSKNVSVSEQVVILKWKSNMNYFKNGSKTPGVNVKILTKKKEKETLNFLENGKILGTQHLKFLTSATVLLQVLVHLLYYFTMEQESQFNI